MNRTVVVTGLGLVTPLGTGQADFAARLFQGRSGIRPIAAFDTASFPSHLGAEVNGFDPKDHISIKNRRRMDRLSQLATASARMALEDAGFAVTAANRDRVGIVLGVAFGSTDVATRFIGTLFTEGPHRVNPILVPNTVMNAPAGHAAIELGLRGINTTVNHREASSETAIAYAAAEIRKGRADLLLAGGADIVSSFFMEIMTRFKTLSPQDGRAEAARPYDRRRNGMVLGEGAGILCLESWEHALARGAVPYCEVAGWGLASATAPLTDWPRDPRGPALAIERALAAAGIAPHQIDLVCGSANGGRRLDRLEAEALASVFDQTSDRPWITSLKGALGESFSSGGIRAAAMALALKGRVLPPTLGLDTPLAALNFVRQRTEMPSLCWGLVNGLASGGTFAALILKRSDGARASEETPDEHR
jgi:3-oxoacyl-[acyl-carrier-protein] synthase II